MHVSGIICKYDDSDSTPSPYAAISGFIPRNVIVFPKHCLEFLEQFPNHAEAVIAHEISHLRKDCRQFRKYALLSRLGLLGPGIFTVFHNSAAIEESANIVARNYLKDYNMDPLILDEAMRRMNNLIDAHNNFGKNTITKSTHLTSRDLFSNPSWKFWKHYLRYMPQIIYDFYFNREMYDYIHPRKNIR